MLIATPGRSQRGLLTHVHPREGFSSPGGQIPKYLYYTIKLEVELCDPLEGSYAHHCTTNACDPLGQTANS